MPPAPIPPVFEPRELRRRAPWVVLGLALLARVLFGAEFVARDLGFEASPDRDMHHYLTGGRGVREGDLDLEATHGCYRFFVDRYGDDLFHRLYGERPFTNAPLYFWLLGATLLPQDGPHLARALQLLANLLCGLLVYVLARSIGLGRREALAAMTLYSLHPTSVLYAAYLLRETLLTTLLLGFVVALAWLNRSASSRAAAACGLLLGLLHLTKTTLPLCAPLLALGLARTPATRRRRAGLGLAALAGFLLVASPLVARNLRAGCSPLHAESFTHYNLVAFNHPGADGLHFVLPPDGLFREVILEGGSTPAGTLRAVIRRFESPLGWPALELRKLRGFWSGYEAPNNIDPHASSRLLATLRLFPVSSAVLLPLGLVGAALALRRLPETWPALGGLGVVLASCLAAAALARYRLFAFPFLAVLAALAWREASRVRWTRLAPLALGAAALALPVRSPERADWQVASYVGTLLQSSGRRAEARDQALRAALGHPLASAAPLGSTRLPATPEWEEFVALNRWAHSLCAELGDDQGTERVRANLARHLVAGR